MPCISLSQVLVMGFDEYFLIVCILLEVFNVIVWLLWAARLPVVQRHLIHHLPTRKVWLGFFANWVSIQLWASSKWLGASMLMFRLPRVEAMTCSSKPLNSFTIGPALKESAKHKSAIFYNTHIPCSRSVLLPHAQCSQMLLGLTYCLL